MPIYISPNALATCGTSEKTIEPGILLNLPLRSELFKGNSLLQKANVNAIATQLVGEESKMKQEDMNEAIKLVKLGFNILIDQQVINSPYGFLNDSNPVIDSQTESIVEILQTNLNLEVTGIMDPPTLFQLDRLLYDMAPNLQYDVLADGRWTYVGTKTGNGLQFRFTQDNAYVYFQDAATIGAPLDLSTSQVRTLKAIVKYDSSQIGNDLLPVEMYSELLELAEQQTLQLSPQTAYVDREGIRLITATGDEVEATDQNILNELEGVPPNPLGEQAKLYRVSATDSFVDIVLENYYNTAAEELKNPYEENAIPYFTLPSRTASPTTERDEDARMMFYLNLLYYYNTKEDSLGGISTYGMKAAPGYVPYNPENLNQFYIFDNAYDSADPETALPNYYRFLRAQTNNGNNTSTIQFDSSGNTSTFIPDGGKYIWIPSRRFADCLYNHINFRHFEMIENAGTALEDYVDDISGFLSDISLNSVITSLGNYAQNEIIETYEEVLGMLKAGYNWIVQNLIDLWPRGMGGYLKIEAGVTWGIPIGTDISGEYQLWRKFTKHSDMTLMLSQEVEVKVGLDIAWGISISGRAGVNSGSGKKRPPLGLNIGAGVTAGVKAKMKMEYEFPIRRSETGLISAIIAATGSAVLSITSEILASLNVINISPMNYVTKMTFGRGVEISGWAQAQFALSDDNIEPNNVINQPSLPESTQVQNREKSYLNPQNIISNTPLSFVNAGLSIDLNVQLGSDYILSYEYDIDSLIPEANSRVPKAVKQERLFYVKGTLNTGAVGSILQRFFLNAGLGPVFSFLNFDTGFAFSLVYEFERTMAARNISSSDIDISGADYQNTSISDNNGNMKFDGTGWQSFMKVGTYSGNIDKLCVAGTESTLKLNTSQIFAILTNAEPFSITNLDSIVKIFHSYIFKYKIAYLKDSGDRKNLSGAVYKNLRKGESFQGSKSALLESARSIPFGASMGLGLNLEMEFKFGDILEVIKYYMRYHYLVFVELIDIDEQAYLEDKKNRTIINFSSDSISGSAYHAQVYNDLSTDLHTRYPILDTASFSEQLLANLTIFIQFREYLRGERGDIHSALGVTDIIKALSMAAEILNTNLTLEGKLGIEASGRLKVGAEGLTARLALSGELALMDHTQLMEDGVIFEPEPGDPLEPTINAIKTVLQTGPEPLRDGIRDTILKIQAIAK